ncbi:dipeptidase [Winogradskyella litorisediminis]|uniref:Dipeptidase n=1 Tax=Winogradskyella litorisediminis TaxID=1156618 RepID=A0ABW3N2D4_9FLAO
MRPTKTLILLIITILFLSCKSETKTEAELLAYAKDIHERVITLDTHCDINVKNFTDSINYTQRLKTQVNLPKMIEGGLDVPWFIVYTGQDSLSRQGFENAYDNAMSKFNAIHRLVKQYAPDKIELATTSDDVRRIVKSGKKAAMIGIENGYPVGLNIENVEKFYNLGARYMSLSHNGHSQLCDSNTGEADGVWLHNGVSDFGKLVIAEMNRLGMMIDVSHPSKEAMRQMIELTKAPIIASHSSARALCNHSRNLDDEQLQWLKENGGVVQTVAFRTYVSDKKDKKDVNVSDFIDHIDYLVEKIGIDHVGISSDFDGGGGVNGWDDASETFNVTHELVKRGYSEKEIEQLWSGNLFRVLDECAAVAESLK